MKGNPYHELVTDSIIEYREHAYRLAYSYVGNKEDALDIVQESICKALASSKSLKDQMAVKAWFFRIVVNTSIDFIRKKKRYLYVEDEVLENLSGSQNDRYEDFDLRRAMEKLSVRDRSIITLRYFEGMKIEEIALVMDENINTIKSRLYATLRKLRVNLEQQAV